jgi:hypothetical protein
LLAAYDEPRETHAVDLAVVDVTADAARIALESAWDPRRERVIVAQPPHSPSTSRRLTRIYLSFFPVAQPARNSAMSLPIEVASLCSLSVESPPAIPMTPIRF